MPKLKTNSAAKKRFHVKKSGKVKHARHIQMKDLAEVNKPALKYYVKQALKLEK